MKTWTLRCLMAICLVGLLTGNVFAKKGKGNKDKEPEPERDSNCYLESISDKQLVLEKEGVSLTFSISEETQFKCGFDGIPRKCLKSGIKIVIPSEQPGSLLSSVEVVPIFKKENKEGDDQADKDEDPGVFFVSLEEGVMTVIASGQKQLLRVDESTTYKTMEGIADKGALTGGTKLILSSTVPWGYVSNVEILAETARKKPPAEPTPPKKGKK